MKLVIPTFISLTLIACSTAPTPHSQATSRNPSAMACTAACVMEDDTSLVNVNLFPTLAKNFGRISAESFEELFRKCDNLVKVAIRSNQIPYSLPNVLSSDTLFSPRLYNNLEITRNDSYESIHSRSVRANPENSCK